MKEKRSRKVIAVAVSTGILIAAILIIGTLWSGHKARQDTEKAVSSVSLFYLDELAGRREQVVSSALKKNIKDLKTAVGLMTADDLDDIEHLQDYQARMKSCTPLTSSHLLTRTERYTLRSVRRTTSVNTTSTTRT